MAELKPDLIVGWLYIGALSAIIGRTLSRGTAPMVWSIRQSLHLPSEKTIRTRILLMVLGLLSRKPSAVLYNSNVSRDHHESIGILPSRSEVIPNGFDTERFKPSKQARSLLRQKLGLTAATPLIGFVARYHPIKDFQTFLHAVHQALQGRSDIHAVLVGTDVTPENLELGQIIDRLNIRAHIHLLGASNEPESIIPGFDLLCLSSRAEGFPNVVGEAMACEVPCLVTDVGDCRFVVGETGIVVPPQSSSDMADAIARFFQRSIEERIEMGRLARQRVIELFSLSIMITRHNSFFKSLLTTSSSNSCAAS